MFFSLFALFAGIFSIVCAAKDYDWFMNNYRARLVVAVMGRPAARVFYIVLGVALSGLSVVIFLAEPS